MSAFDAAWLALREPADATARAADLASTLATVLAAPKAVGAPRPRAARPLEVVDLGAGTGSGLRWLAPRLPGPQRWTLVDHDETLLAEAPRALAQWAEARSAEAIPGPGPDAALILRGAGLDLRVATLRRDLDADLERLSLGAADLIAGTALLDLVSAGWLERLAHAAAGTPILFALTVDGRLSFAPSDPFDDAVRRAFERHQRGDKGFGPALGSAAARQAPAILAGAGYRIATADTPWHLGRGESALVGDLIEGYAAAAAETGGLPPEDLRTWCARRQAAAAAGALSLTVGHVDLLALPADAG